jgi:hypothetical protein
LNAAFLKELALYPNWTDGSHDFSKKGRSFIFNSPLQSADTDGVRQHFAVLCALRQYAVTQRATSSSATASLRRRAGAQHKEHEHGQTKPDVARAESCQ